MERRQFVVLLSTLFIGLGPFFNANAQSKNITIHLRGVTETKISLMPMSGTKQFKTIAELKSVKNGETASLPIPAEYMPGEFVLRFDYKEKSESTPYPSEKRILIGNDPIELWMHPMFANNPDSSWFGKEEKENAAFALFSTENARQKQKIGLLQQFLMEYDSPDSDFYLQGIKEYEKRRQAYNNWLDQKVKEDATLFASSLYRFNFLPQIVFQGNEKDRLLSLIAHYFDGIDFNDPVIIKTAQMNDWMNSYVNLHGQMATTAALRDSLIPAAARSAIEKARLGDPLVYGWMVDYFYRGFETNDMPQGMKVLEPYLNDPACLTTQRMEIERRLKGMENLKPGIIAPDFSLIDRDKTIFTLSTFRSEQKYILILFWSADCSHCKETIDVVYPWSLKAEVKQNLAVVAVSLDETETEVAAWENKSSELNGWKHLRATEGINSKIANDYFILATPVMVLLDAKTRKIIAMPDTPGELATLVR
ncbi:MAG: redoxin domain-containing protein [Bacteroidales bacterium]|nr:redoxin domain-containing protein [Bacteroidales bacterium]